MTKLMECLKVEDRAERVREMMVVFVNTKGKDRKALVDETIESLGKDNNLTIGQYKAIVIEINTALELVTKGEMDAKKQAVRAIPGKVVKTTSIFGGAFLGGMLEEAKAWRTAVTSVTSKVSAPVKDKFQMAKIEMAESKVSKLEREIAELRKQLEEK